MLICKVSIGATKVIAFLVSSRMSGRGPDMTISVYSLSVAFSNDAIERCLVLCDTTAFRSQARYSCKEKLSLEDMNCAAVSDTVHPLVAMNPPNKFFSILFSHSMATPYRIGYCKNDFDFRHGTVPTLVVRI